MTHLNSSMHALLSNHVIAQCQTQNISTVVEFYIEDTEKLMTLTGLCFKDIQELKQFISKTFGGIVKNPSLLFKQETENIVSTGIVRLDNLLKGGLYSGQIYELCGTSSSGKTQLALTIAANIALRCNGIIRYIDTKGDFFASRTQEILKSKQRDKENVDDVMQLIRISRVYNLRQLFGTLCHFTSVLKTEQKQCRTKIIIIDSLPAILFKFPNDLEMSYALNHLANTCRFLANEFYLSVLTLNLITQWNDNLSKCTDVKNCNDQVIVPTLGKYWQRIPNTRLSVQKLENGYRKITVWKSFQLEADKSCIVRLCDNGII